MASSTSVEDTAGDRRKPGPPTPPAQGGGTGTASNAARGSDSTRSDAAASEDVPGSPRRVLGYRRQRFEARKVRRLIRHVDPWSVLKLSLLVALCMWIVAMIASVIIWSVANNTGALASLEEFFNKNLQLEDFKLTGDVLFRQFGLISLLGALGFAATMVVASLMFNLISDIIGGVWVSVIEEETARPIVDVSWSGEPRSPAR